MKQSWRPFEEARAYARGLGLANSGEWSSHCRCGQKPDDIPATPRSAYGSDFKGWGDWLGTGYVCARLREYLPFEEARAFVRALGLKGQIAWKAYCASGAKPTTIPSNPNAVYRAEFQGYGDWLGTGHIRNGRREYLPFEEARAFVRALGLKSVSAWREYCDSGAKPDTIPADPQTVYDAAFAGFGDWLGTGTVATYKREYLPFEEARAFVRALGLKNQDEWVSYCTAGTKPDSIPSNPHHTYRHAYLGMGDWLGTGTLSSTAKSRMYLSFKEARAFVRALGLKNSEEWVAYTKSGGKPATIPSDPRGSYGAAFTSMGDWLGTDYIAQALREYLPFEEARAFVRALGLSSWEEWYAYCKSGEKPANIPADPSHVYPEFRGAGDWFGTRIWWNAKSLRGLLQDLRPLLSYLNEQELYTILQQGGAMAVLRRALGGVSPLQVLRKLVDAERSQDPLTAIGQCGDALDNEIAPIETLTEEAELPLLGGNTHEPCDGPPFHLLSPPESGAVTAEQLRVIDNLSSIPGGLDEEAVEFLVTNRVHALWDLYCNEGREAVEPLLEGRGGAYFSEITRRFLAEMRAVEALALPRGWAFRDASGTPALPNAMQRYTAWALLERRRWGNWSGTGAGKTLSAVLASRVCQARLTLVITNYATVEGWKRQILSAYPDSAVYTQMQLARDEVFCRERFTYLVLNYEKFQGKERQRLIERLLEVAIDFIVFDEVQFVKQRDAQASLRRQAIESLVERAARINPSLRVLGMSATPVVNNLQEAQKLLEIVTGETFSHLDAKATVHNGLETHRALMRYGYRYRPRYEQEMRTEYLTTTRNDLFAGLRRAGDSVLAVEQVLLPAKLEAARAHFHKGTIAYSYYVDEMIEPICAFLAQLGLSVGRYIGSDKSGLEGFLAGAIDVLIGSKPVGTGLDGLQAVCNRIVILSLPWTSVEYEQLIGRVRRQASAFGEVDIIVPQVVLEGRSEKWSWDQGRMEIIQAKRTLSDCAIDGRIPEMVRISEQALLRRSRRALERWIGKVGTGPHSPARHGEQREPAG